MNPSNIVRVGAVCAALVVGACGFSPSGQVATRAPAPASAAGVRAGIGNFGGSSSSGQGGLTGQGGGHAMRLRRPALVQASARHPDRARRVGFHERGLGERELHRRLRRELEVGAADARAQPGRDADRDRGELGPQAVRRHEQHLWRRPQHGRCSRRGQQRRRDCGGDRGAHRRGRQRHQRQPHAHAGRGECGRDVPRRADRPQSQVHPDGHGRPAELPRQRQFAERRLARRDRGGRPPRRPPVFRPSSSASPHRRARPTTRSTAWRTRAVTRARATPGITR